MLFTTRRHHHSSVPHSVAPNGCPFLKLSQAYVLSLWLPITLLVLSSGPAYAEWVLVSGNDATGLSVYVDTATLRRNGNLAKMWQLYDYKTVQTVAGDSLLSFKRFNEYDCAEARTRMLGYTWFSGNMGNGSVVYSTTEHQPWEPVVPRTINRTLWNVACDKK